MHRRTETWLIKIKSYRVFLMSLPWAWPSSENWTSHCFMKAFFFLLTILWITLLCRITHSTILPLRIHGAPQRDGQLSPCCAGGGCQYTGTQKENPKEPKTDKIKPEAAPKVCTRQRVKPLNKTKKELSTLERRRVTPWWTSSGKRRNYYPVSDQSFWINPIPN